MCISDNQTGTIPTFSIIRVHSHDAHTRRQTNRWAYEKIYRGLNVPSGKVLYLWEERRRRDGGGDLCRVREGETEDVVEITSLTMPGEIIWKFYSQCQLLAIVSRTVNVQLKDDYPGELFRTCVRGEESWEEAGDSRHSHKRNSLRHWSRYRKTITSYRLHGSL